MEVLKKEKMQMDDCALAHCLHSILEDGFAGNSPLKEQAIFDSFATTDYLIAKENDQVVGFISYQQNFDVVDIDYIVVSSALQNKGVGGFLIQSFFQQFVTQNKATEFFLEVRASNIRAIHFYEKYGFIQIHRRKNYYSNQAEDAIIYKMSVKG